MHEVLDTVGLTSVARKKAKGFSLGHGAAARHRGRAARRPADPDVRRAGQRPRPRGHPLDPQPDEVPGRPGPDGLRLLASDERDGADRRPSRRHRPGPAARRHLDGGLHRSRTRGRTSGSAPRSGSGCSTCCTRPGSPSWRPATGRWRWTAAKPERIGELAAQHQIVLHELSPQQASLEEAFMQLTAESVEYHAHADTRPHPAARAGSRGPGPAAWGRRLEGGADAWRRTQVVRSEWTKIRSVASTVWTLVARRGRHDRARRADLAAVEERVRRHEPTRTGSPSTRRSSASPG